MKIIKYFLFFFLLLQLPLQAQTVKRDSMHCHQKWTIDVLGSPNYVYRTVREGTPFLSRYPTPYYSYTTKDQIGKFGWHLGLTVSRKIHANFYFQTGIWIDRKGYTTKKFNDTLYQVLPPTPNYRILTSFRNYTYTFVGIPLFVSYKKELTEKIYLGLTAGITSNFLIRGTLNAYHGSDEGAAPFSEPENKIWQWPIIAYGKFDFIYKYECNRAISLSPTFSYCLKPFHDIDTRDGNNKELHFFSAGLEIGMHYYLGKK
jgi:Outer membrane protein beta-barrel domain